MKNDRMCNKERVLPQIEFGTKITSSVNQPTFIFATLWPSWLYAAKASGYENLVVHVEDDKTGVKEIIQAGLSVKGQLVDWLSWKMLLQTQLERISTENVLVLFQGPRDALNRVLTFLSSLYEAGGRVEILAFATNATSSNRARKKRQRLMQMMDVQPTAVLSHQMVGGVIDHAWTLESNVRGLIDVKSHLEQYTRVQAILADYLSHTQVGKVVKASEEGSNQVKEKVIWKQRTFKVTSRSVFSTTGWVHRSIVDEELMDVYDVGVGDRKLMKKVLVEKKYDKFPLEFTQQIPVRVLLRCLNVKGMMERKAETAECLPTQAKEAGGAMTHVRLEKGLVNSLRSNNTVMAIKGVSDEDKKLAKNDDATAQVSNWNKRVCDRLKCDYLPAVHDPALDGFRRLALSWYRSYKGGVIRSFVDICAQSMEMIGCCKCMRGIRCVTQSNSKSITN
jgi:hypothetical protein